MKKMKWLLASSLLTLTMSLMFSCAGKTILPSNEVPVFPEKIPFTVEGMKIIIDAKDWQKLQGKICFDTGYYDSQIAEKLDRCSAILQLKQETK